MRKSDNQGVVMYTRNEMIYLLQNWGVWARGLGCPTCNSQLAPKTSTDDYDSDLAIKVERGLVECSKTCNIQPIIEFYCYNYSIKKIAKMRDISTFEAIRKIEVIEDVLSTIIF